MNMKIKETRTPKEYKKHKNRHVSHSGKSVPKISPSWDLEDIISSKQHVYSCLTHQLASLLSLKAVKQGIGKFKYGILQHNKRNPVQFSPSCVSTAWSPHPLGQAEASGLGCFRLWTTTYTPFSMCVVTAKAGKHSSRGHASLSEAAPRKAARSLFLGCLLSKIGLQH